MTFQNSVTGIPLSGIGAETPESSSRVRSIEIGGGKSLLQIGEDLVIASLDAEGKPTAGIIIGSARKDGPAEWRDGSGVADFVKAQL